MFWSKKQNKKPICTGFQGDCSAEQLNQLFKFKEFVIELNGKVENPKYDDIYLLRFLRARKFNQTQTRKMWDNFIKWRAKNDIDNAFNFHVPQLLQLRKQYPHGYHKVDKKFRPIYIERVGFINVDKIFKFTTPERLLKYYSVSYETLLQYILKACSKERQKKTGDNQAIVEQTLTILDLKDVKLGNASKAYDFIKPASQMAQDNYPEILGNMFIINAPFLFTGIWAIVKMWIDEKTKNKIKILGGSYKDQLLEFIDPQNLPDFIDGGKCKCQGGNCLEKNIGPWNPEGKQMFENQINGQQKNQGFSGNKIQNQGFSENKIQNQGFSQGKNEPQNQGFSQGKNETQNQGFSQGKNEPQNQGFSQGKNEPQNQGFNDKTLSKQCSDKIQQINLNDAKIAQKGVNQ